MFERFTDRARKVMALANQEAQRFNHEYIGTEHILLGLVKEGSGVGANVLKNLDVDLRKVRLEVEKLVHSGPDMVTMGKLPQTPRAKKVIEYAIEEARNLNHNYVGTEHLLLGLLRPSAGEIRVLGHRPGHRATRARVGYLPEESRFHGFLTARQTLRFYAGLFPQLDRATRRARCEELLEFVDAIVTSRPPASTGEALCRAQQVVASVLQSLTTGRPRYLDLETGEARDEQ